MVQKGFAEEDRKAKPGVLIDSDTRSVRVYRSIGIDFWSLIGSPSNPINLGARNPPMPMIKQRNIP